ncbi:MAG: hypothetical protein IPO92_18975 [Saprospiraceae bacterium]|nr:hypothetical protein [Saprospiraceae bacterium]
MSTSYDNIIQSISAMDVQALHSILDDHRTYNDISKNEFISRISAVFDYFIEECGEHKLVPLQVFVVHLPA